MHGHPVIPLLNIFIAGAAPTYKEYSDFLMSTAKKLEDSVTDNSLSREMNDAESDYM